MVLIKRKSLLLVFTVAALAAASCAKENYSNQNGQPDGYVDVIDSSNADGYYAYAEISVPAGTKSVMVETYALDSQGRKKDLKSKRVDVTPEIKVPTDGKDCDPFGRVRFLFTSKNSTLVSVYYTVSGDVPATDVKSSANEDRTHEAVYALSDFPLDQVAFGEFGKTRYVQVPWSFAYSQDENWQPVKSYPSDVVFYDQEHNHTLRYKFAYTGGNGPAYFLDDAYEIADYNIVKVKNNYCGGCNACPYCMPWGCSCGCGSVNSNFIPSGDTCQGNKAPASSPIAAPADVVPVYLEEPAPYITHDADQTFYHSSGVVMFEDSWPQHSLGGPYDADYNDVVIDYDIEAKTVADHLLPTEGWREQVKAVIHVRAVGSNYPWRVGMILENFNMDYVEKVTEYKTLDSYNSGHGELPSWTVGTLQENSLHYDPLATQYATSVNTRPAIEIGGLQRYNEKGFNAGTETYIYTNNGKSEEHVMNPGLKQYEDVWGGPHTEQYSPSLATDSELPLTLAKLQEMTYYNVIPGYVNVAGGLYTYTVVYEMKARADMTPEQREVVKQNMIDAVVNTTSQNFYIVKQDYTPVGLKGYAPVDFSTKNYSNYATKYQQVALANADNLDLSTYYKGKNGEIWGVKCPTLTKHVWDKLYFTKAYPHFEEWALSGGTQGTDWYISDVNGDYLSCWW